MAAQGKSHDKMLQRMGDSASLALTKRRLIPSDDNYFFDLLFCPVALHCGYLPLLVYLTPCVTTKLIYRRQLRITEDAAKIPTKYNEYKQSAHDLSGTQWKIHRKYQQQELITPQLPSQPPAKYPLHLGHQLRQEANPHK